jgi:NAD(P)H-flavin reductase
MLARKYKSQIVSIENLVEDIYTIKLSSLNKKYKYYPGQFLHLSIDSDYDGIGQWPESRCFSMQSNPDENIIKISYAVKGKYTDEMKRNLNQGDTVWLKLPFGNLFTQSHNTTNTVFIAGGTGITPFLSLFTSKLFTQYVSPRIYLGFRTDSHNIFKNDLKQIDKNSQNNSPSILSIKHQNVDGIIDIKKIFFENGLKCNYFISGPPQMIKNFKYYLVGEGVRQRFILTDEWE